MLQRLLQWLFPPKCILCRRILPDDRTDLCHVCRTDAPEINRVNLKIPFVARWTAVWYYKDTVRRSILRYKFYNQRSYARAYGRAVAMKLLGEDMAQADVLTWVPTAALRRLRRGYDQVALLARAVGSELNQSAVCTLKKIRNTPPQSRLRDAAARRANVLGAYRVIDPACVAGKRVLLLDDIVTSGATVSECARELLTAGAKEVICAAIAAAPPKKK